MALSDKVTESLNNAEAELRNALSFAARQERPMICGGIAEILSRIESLQKMETLVDKAEAFTNDGDDNPFKMFFNQ